MTWSWLARWRHARLPTHLKSQSKHWMPIVPVHLIADRDTLILAPRDCLDLTMEESQSMAESFNTHFVLEELSMVVVCPDEWWLGSNQVWHLRFPSVVNAESMNLRDALQHGEDARAWRRLLNETQMLWFSHPANQLRITSGKPEVNGFWCV